MSKNKAESADDESFIMSRRDYNDLMIMLTESRNRMMRVAMDGSRAGDWCKNIGQHLDDIEQKYR